MRLMPYSKYYIDKCSKSVRSLILFAILYSTLVPLTVTILLLLSEYRIDVYISLFILEYYILRGIISPLPHDVNKRLKFIDISYFLIFIIIVSYRIILILGLV